MVNYKKKAYSDSKRGKILRWKRMGLKDDFNMVWDRFINSTHCENPKCNVLYGEKGDGNGNWKCMDHDHTPGMENNFRNILCNNCNVNLKLNNTSGTPNICRQHSGWQYGKSINGKRHTKFFKYYYDAIVYKYIYEAFTFCQQSEP